MRNCISHLKITPTYSVEYYTDDDMRAPPGRPPDCNVSDGYLSAKAMVRLRERINLMVYMSKIKTLRRKKYNWMTDYKLVFLTLTLSSAQVHSDRIIKEKLLQPFLRIMRRRWKVVNYVWKAEAQDNGNIHFHITTHKYIHWQEVREVWNTLQESLENYYSCN